MKPKPMKSTPTKPPTTPRTPGRRLKPAYQGEKSYKEHSENSFIGPKSLEKITPNFAPNLPPIERTHPPQHSTPAPVTEAARTAIGCQNFKSSGGKPPPNQLGVRSARTLATTNLTTPDWIALYGKKI